MFKYIFYICGRFHFSFFFKFMSYKFPLRSILPYFFKFMSYEFPLSIYYVNVIN